MKIAFLFLACVVFHASLCAQPDRWQQRVKYVMDIDMDVNSNRYNGKQHLIYTNNSPDTLSVVFYHLYYNAFQPGSMMDEKNRAAEKAVLGKDAAGNDVFDGDERIGDRIYNLKPDEIGYQKILSLKMNNIDQQYQVLETILKVKLHKPVLPHSQVTFDMVFEAQVPLQIRRGGRNSPSTGVRYSMGQWYPKLCEYDYNGWHPTPYAAREFYGVWGDFDVKISIDKNYILGGTGYLQNGNEIGYGYETGGAKVVRPEGKKLTWHFVAPNVHDFMWAADPHFKHIVRKTQKGVLIHVLYNGDPAFLKQKFDTMGLFTRTMYKNNIDTFAKSWQNQWQQVADAAVIALPFIEEKFGPYPYRQYSFINGGDGGTEYPMSTQMNRANPGLAFHEFMHSWYQMMLGTNESLFAWMDEGFVDYAGALVKNYYYKHIAHNADTRPSQPFNGTELHVHQDAYRSYFNLVRSGYEEPLNTHADHYLTNYAYNAAYGKGAVFVEQLGYITGAAIRDKTLLEYYRLWSFKHPNADDFINVAEKCSGLKLHWYKEYWINTTRTIDYGIDSIWDEKGTVRIRLRNKGTMPMPVDIHIVFADGSRKVHYIPMSLMFGEKPVEFTAVPRTVHEAWKWTHQTYTIDIDKRLSDMLSVEIDPTQRMADINRRDNKKEFKSSR